MSKFKKGDRVRLVRDNNGYGYTGDTGEIVSPDTGSDDALVRFDRKINGYHEWFAPWSSLELVPAEEPTSIATGSAQDDKPKFKVGDRVRLVREGLSTTGAVGLTAVIESIEADSKWPFLLRFDSADLYRFSTMAVTKEYTRAVESDFELVETKKPSILDSLVGRTLTIRTATATRPAIVCLLENGQPKPSDRPHVHLSTADAEREASRLASRYQGKEFGVYELVSSKHHEPVYDYEWQRLAASGQKIAAIKELRARNGTTLYGTKQAVEHWLSQQDAA